MKYRTAIRWARNPLLAALLLVAFCTRALIPAGFMPGPGGLVICNGYAPARGDATSQPISHDTSATGMAAMDMAGIDMSGMDMSKHAGQNPNDGGSPYHMASNLCPFAAAATTMASSPTAVLVAVVHSVTHRIELPNQAIIPRDTVVPTRLPRGPPAQA